MFLDCDKHFDGEQGEISTPKFHNSHFSEIACIYTINVPRERRITVELIAGKSITQQCNNLGNNDLRNYKSKEKLQVHVSIEEKSKKRNFVYKNLFCLVSQTKCF